ncbi:amino acid adenylation domain-containing protein [Streptomyces albidocamelliae]|uniref:Amino acid adenylation domain-containing protein n=1 Tax=Streptomyces albidocamelliae TaxID=2981135 RepID=A0ABY6EEW8_9ACTN|nr:amino acid adenylation domain-containing protein [Streptomyces sp. HUAS 14-6]UXY33424.1 amino acid adenylation domain-containing protein [Streptomyces sp. HUAS 14-6]
MTSVRSGTPTRTPTPSPPVPDTRPDTDGDAVLLVTDHPRTRDAADTALASVRLRNAATPHDLAAFALLLHRYTGQRRLLLDVDLSGRGAGALTLAVEPDEPASALLARTAHAAPHRRPAETAVRYADHAVPAGSAELELTRDGTDLLLGYRPSLFDEPTVRRLGDHLRRVAAFLDRSPQAPVHAADLLGEDERALILGTFNDTSRPYPDSAGIPALFGEQARRTPDATAVTDRSGRLTYGELDAAADRLAHAIRAAGARHGERVGLRTGRTADLVVGALGILKAGCAYLPLETGLPARRTEWLLADASVRVLVTSPEVPADFVFDGTVLHPTGHPSPHPAGHPSPHPADHLTVPPAAADLAYICYTSGTTGQPKGVEVTHRNVVRLVKGTDYVRFGRPLRVLPTGSIAFDASTFELWGPLLNGGSVHLVDSDVILDARALGRELAAHDITTLWLTSPLFNQLVEQDATAFRGLRELVVGGDALSSVHVAKAMTACPGVTLVNGYGPTENTTFSLTHRITRDDLGRIPIGRPIAHSTAYILDDRGRLCPVGVPGELCLGGDGVARGYLGRPELTAERFVPDLFSPGGGRLYRSGDLARWRPDGTVEFLGRRDHQVKVRGFRIEPAEVEKAMLGHPDVAEAIVLARSRPGRGEKYLCGYYAGPRPPAPEDLRDHLAQALAPHMVPAHLVPLEALPLNHTGKVDRAALPDPGGAHLPPGTPAVPPSDDIERALVDLAEQALGIKGLGVAHDLRDLGADSLTATLIAAGVREVLGRDCPVSAVLRSRTLGGLAALVRGSAPVTEPAIRPAPPRPSYPVTPQQRRLYFEQLKDERAVHYNVPITLALPAHTDTLRLTDALRRLTRRHDALRTRFAVTDDGEVVQHIDDDAEPSIQVHDGEPGPLAAFVRPFDLSEAPLWRAEVHRTPAAVTLRLDLHHIVVDGYSLAPLFEDLDALYAGDEPPPPTLRYRDYAVWLTGPEGRRQQKSQEAYWRQEFASPPDPGDLPTDRPRPPLRELAGDVVTFDLGPDRTARLRELARQRDVTLFAVLASAYGILLGRLKGTAHVTFGTPVSGRTAPGLHRTVGMFAQTVCLRGDADPALPYETYLRHTTRTAEEAFAHQDFPFDDVVALAAPVRDYSRTPLFDALIALHSGRYAAVDFQGARVPLRLEPTGQAVFDLNLQIHEDAGTLRAAWQYASGLFRRDTVEGWRDDLVALLDALAADPTAPLGALCPDRPERPARAAADILTAELDFDL